MEHNIQALVEKGWAKRCRPNWCCLLGFHCGYSGGDWSGHSSPQTSQRKAERVSQSLEARKSFFLAVIMCVERLRGILTKMNSFWDWPVSSDTGVESHQRRKWTMRLCFFISSQGVWFTLACALNLFPLLPLTSSHHFLLLISSDTLFCFYSFSKRTQTEYVHVINVNNPKGFLCSYTTIPDPNIYKKEVSLGCNK